MKKKVLLMSAMLCLFFSTAAFSQTVVTLYYTNAPQYNPCYVPQNVWFNYYGHVNGYLPSDTITLSINWGDGSDTTVYMDSTYVSIYGQVTHHYSSPGIYSTIFILSGPDGNSDTVVNYDQIVLTNTCGHITGTVYADTNSNCIIDPAEDRLQGIVVRLYRNGLLHASTVSDTAGNYGFHVPAGPVYDVVIDTNILTYFSLTCPVSGVYPNVTVPSSGLNFGLICNHPGFDLNGYLSGWGFRPGFHGQIHAHVHNDGCEIQNGHVKMVLDPLLHFVSSTPPPQTIIGDTLIWQHTSLTHFDYFSASIIVMTDLSAIVGDSVDGLMIILPVTGDLVPGNNVLHKRWPVRNSWDPNEKAVIPAGDGLMGYIQPGTRLEYTVYFQNTGNDTAYNIFIIDSIDQDLDINTFEMLGASHPCETHLLNGSVLKFNFNHIMLPDSGTDMAGSQGFVAFALTPKITLSDGTPLTNEAGIYFDFNPPVITNYVLNTISFTLGETEPLPADGIRIFPNPLHTTAVIMLPEDIRTEGPITLTVFDITGKKVREFDYLSKEPIIFNREGLSNGVFFFHLTDVENQVIAFGKLIVL